MPGDVEYRVWKFWNKFLFGMVVLPWYAAYDAWRGDGWADLRNPRVVAFVVTWEVAALWCAWRKRVRWLPRRRASGGEE